MLLKKLKRLRDKLSLVQKAAGMARIAESAHRAYGLGDRNPKPEILDRVVKALGVRPEYLSAPTFGNRREFVYVILENEDAFGYDVRDVDAVSAIVKGYGFVTELFNELIRDCKETHERLNSHETTKEEHKHWKRTWANGTWVKTDDGKSPYTGR